MKIKSLKVNAILNSTKQCCSVLFPLISFPYISRILGTATYGMYSYSNSIANYFILLAALGINTYAIREGAKIRDNKAKFSVFANEIYTINWLSTICSMIVVVLMLSCMESLRIYRTLIFIQSLQMILVTSGADWINSIYEDYIYLTFRYIILQIIGLILIFCFVKTPNDVHIYSLINVFVVSGGNLINWFYVKRYVNLKVTYHMNFYKHIKPIFVLFADTLAITLYVNSDITMLGIWYNDTIVGIYSLAAKIYNILKLLVNSLVVVAMPRIAYLSANDKIHQLLGQILNMLFCIVIPCVTGLICVSDSIVCLIGGKEYKSGVYPLSILAFAIVFAVLGAYFTSCILIVHNLEKKCLFATSSSATINIIINLYAIPYYGFYGAAVTTVLAEVVSCTIKGYYALPYMELKLINIRDLTSSVLGAMFIIVICVVSHIYIENLFLRLIVEVFLSITAYIIVLLLSKNSLIFKDRGDKRR